MHLANLRAHLFARTAEILVDDRMRQKQFVFHAQTLKAAVRETLGRGIPDEAGAQAQPSFIRGLQFANPPNSPPYKRIEALGR